MTFASTDDALLIREAFSDAWRLLLSQERVTADNVVHAPDVLLEAIFEAMEIGERDEQKLVAAAVRKMAHYERTNPLPVDDDNDTVH